MRTLGKVWVAHGLPIWVSAAHALAGQPRGAFGTATCGFGCASGRWPLEDLFAKKEDLVFPTIVIYLLF